MVYEVVICVPTNTLFNKTSYSTASEIDDQDQVGESVFVGDWVFGDGILGGVVSTINILVPNAL